MNVASARYVETLCLLGGSASVAAAAADLPASIDLDQIRVASADATVDATPVTLLAFRLPGHSGGELLSAVGVLSSSTGSGVPGFGNDPAPTSAGGKAVLTWTNAADGAVSYLYTVGDTLFIARDVTPSQADKVFAALP
jgi:hypothetical protein